jgi:hypothetical protein
MFGRRSRAVLPFDFCTLIFEAPGEKLPGAFL